MGGDDGGAGAVTAQLAAKPNQPTTPAGAQAIENPGKTKPREDLSAVAGLYLSGPVCNYSDENRLTRIV